MTTVGIEARCLLGQATGVGRYLRNILREAVALAPDLTFRLYKDRSGPDGLEDLDRIERRALPGDRGRNILRWMHADLPRLIADNPPPLVHFPFYTLPFFHSGPAVLTIHDLTFALHPEWFPWRSRISFGMMAPRSARRAGHVLTVSECSRRDLIRLYRLGENRVTAIPLAAEPSFAPRPREETDAAIARHGLRRPYLIHLGSIHPRRNLEKLLDALAGLGGAFAGVGLVLAGRVEAPYASAEHLVRRPGLEGRVVHLGYVDEKDLPALVAGAAALVYPSLYEGFGLPVLEAMACGTPVLTSNVSALPETAGDAAVLVDPGSVEEMTRGLAAILGDEPLRERLRRAGIERAARFSWKRAAEATVGIYRSVLTGGGRG